MAAKIYIIPIKVKSPPDIMMIFAIYIYKKHNTKKQQNQFQNRIIKKCF